MRGKRNRFWCLGYANRNIPAYAGKTSIPHNLFCPLMEHPRVCGENPIIPAAERGHDGTSPRMRGKQRFHILRLGAARNIPAYAGKTSHGTACGLLPCGTSPRMRGKPQATPPTARTTGNIPAYAGKTTGDTSDRSNNWEHPRVCGENFVACTGGRRHMGTSPRMRGKPHTRHSPGAAIGNIPAYAGKTEPVRLRNQVDSEHPRVCGENVGGT